MGNLPRGLTWLCRHETHLRTQYKLSVGCKIGIRRGPRHIHEPILQMKSNLGATRKLFGLNHVPIVPEWPHFNGSHASLPLL